MNRKSRREASSLFSPPITGREKLFGITLIAVHSFVIPNVLVTLFVISTRSAELPTDTGRLTLCCYLTSFIMTVIFMNRFLKRSFSDVFDRFPTVLMTVVFGVMLNFVTQIAVNLLLSLFMPDTVNPGTKDAIAVTKADYRVAFVTSVLLAPVVEEAMFRGALFCTIRKKSRLLAYIVTVSLFAVYHLWGYFIEDFDPVELLYLLQYVPIGIILARSYERSGTVWSPILIHATANLVAVRAQMAL